MGLSAIPRRSVLVLIGVLVLLVSTVWVANSRADAAAEPSATPVVYIVTGENFPDALGVGPASALNRGPILFVTLKTIPTPTKSELTRLKPDRIVIVGGTAVISPSVESQLKAWAPVQRLGGANRYETAALVSKAAFPAPPFGSGPTAAGAGGRYGSGEDPTILHEDTMTELGALSVTVPANGGVLDITASVMLETPDTSSGSFVYAQMRMDSTCTSTADAIAGASADLTLSWFDSIPLNSGVSVDAGTHTIRLCAAAFHIDPSDTTLVDAARISATWSPTAMGGTVSPFSGASVDSMPDFTSKIEAKRLGG